MDISDRLWSYLDGGAPDRLRRYYAEPHGDNPGFSGRAFDTLAGGGDRKQMADQFTADDIVAVTCLGVRIPAETCIRLLADTTAADLLGARLEGGGPALPVGVDLWDADERFVMNGGVADQLWRHLRGYVGIDWVIAGKLLARKRPQLIPVFDRVVTDALLPQAGGQWWTSLRETCRSTPAIPGRLRELS